MMKNPQLVQIGAYLCRGPLADSCASNSRERKLNVIGNQRSMCGDLLRLLTQTPIQLTSRAQQLFLEVSRTKQKKQRESERLFDTEGPWRQSHSLTKMLMCETNAGFENYKYRLGR